MLRSFIVPALAIASIMPAAVAQKAMTPVTPAIYHPGLEHSSVVLKADYSYSNRRSAYYARKRHRRHKAAKRIGLGAAGGAAVGALAGGGKGALIGGAAGAGAGALYNKHENDKGR